MRLHLPCIAGLAALVVGCHTELTPQGSESILPLRTVRLYETGVGYFERSGTISGDDQASLPVPAGHLDDALKTLVVIGKGDGKSTVAGVEFGSSVSRAMGRALAGLPLDADAPVTHFDMLASLKGAHVEIIGAAASSPPIRGRVIEVLPAAPPPKAEGDAAKSDAKTTSDEGPTMLVAGDDGAIRKLRASDVASVRPTDPAFAARLDAALDALNANASRTPRNLRILLAGGPVTVGYVTETPVWRTTYRVVLGKGDTDPATLQGWALLHNDTDEQWRGVRVTLVNGRPDSFLFPLAAPRYARRELVTPENEASTVPQLMGRTVDAIWGDHIGDSFGAGGLGLSGIGEGGGGRGEGIGLGSIGTIGHGAGVGSNGESSLLEVGDLAGVASAQGVEAGVLFSYTLANGLDMRPHGSALVPFLGAKVDAERITWLASPSDTARAAVRLVNSTAQTLPGGPVAFFADGGFAGEGAIDRLKPKERRFLRFGADLDVELKVDRSDRKAVVKRVTFQNDALVEHSLRTTVSEWALQNRSGTGRRVYVGLPIVKNATVTGADALDFDDQSNNPVAIVKLAPRTEVRRTITSVEGVSSVMQIGSLRAERLAQLLAEPDLAPAEKAAITELDKAQKALEETQKALDKTKSDLAEVAKDSDRLRELLKAAGGDKPAAGGNGGGPLMTRVLAAEDRLTALRKQQETREAERVTRLAAVRAAAEKLPAK